jgi:hypothetical protein
MWPQAVRQLQLMEITEQGAELLAATWGLSSKAAQHLNSLVGGGSKHAFGARAELIHHLTHTVEANGVFVDLIVSARTLERDVGRVAVTWRSAAACARGALRPDGYVMIDDGTDSFGFFLEYDRGTESARDYRRKLSAYYRYYETGRFSQDYEGFPTVLIVTTGPGSEGRLAAAVRAVSLGRPTALPFLLTLTGWLRGPTARLSEPIWRDSWSDQRRIWPRRDARLIAAPLQGDTR